MTTRELYRYFRLTPERSTANQVMSEAEASAQPRGTRFAKLYRAGVGYVTIPGDGVYEADGRGGLTWIDEERFQHELQAPTFHKAYFYLTGNRLWLGWDDDAEKPAPRFDYYEVIFLLDHLVERDVICAYTYDPTTRTFTVHEVPGESPITYAAELIHGKRAWAIGAGTWNWKRSGN